MMPRSAWRAAALSLALGAITLGAQSAHAAAVLVATTPARYAVLIHPLHVISLRFSEAIVKKSSSVTLTDVTGRQVRVKPLKSRGVSSLEVAVDGKLGEGVYTVHWTSVSAVDGRKEAGQYQFTVR